MKKLIVLFTALFLVACSQDATVQYNEIGSHIDTMQAHMEDFSSNKGNYEQLKADTEAYNKALKEIDPANEDMKKFVEYQLQANEYRLAGLKDMDSESITKSAQFQYYATGLYTQFKDQ